MSDASGTVDATGPPALLNAYLDAVYVCGDGREPLLIGGTFSPVPGSGRVHALLTACNPGSRPLSLARNAERMASLRQRLRSLGIGWASAEAAAPDGTWREASVWLRDVAPVVVDSLAAAFDQNAFVRVDACGRVRLRVLRGDWRAHIGDDPRIDLREADCP